MLPTLACFASASASIYLAIYQSYFYGFPAALVFGIVGYRYFKYTQPCLSFCLDPFTPHIILDDINHLLKYKYRNVMIPAIHSLN